MNSSIYAVSVFAGSKSGTNPIFSVEAKTLGALLGHHKLRVIFGGCNSGLMRDVALAAHEAGSMITSVFPLEFSGCAERFKAAAQTYTTKDTHEQRATMRKLSQASIVLPGGINSASELMDAATMNDAAAIARPNEFLKPVIICNIEGRYDWLKTMLETQQADGFTSSHQARMFHFADTALGTMSALLRLASVQAEKAQVLRPRT